jgi:hypothetical protein
MRILKILAQVIDPDNLRLRVVSGTPGRYDDVCGMSISEAIRGLSVEFYDLEYLR